jgi:hypothetical protein
MGAQRFAGAPIHGHEQLHATIAGRRRDRSPFLVTIFSLADPAVFSPHFPGAQIPPIVQAQQKP